MFVALPAIAGLCAFLRFDPPENRIAITSYSEVLRLRAKSAAVTVGAGAFGRDDDHSTVASSVREIGSKPRRDTVRCAAANDGRRAARLARRVRQGSGISSLLGRNGSPSPASGNN